MNKITYMLVLSLLMLGFIGATPIATIGIEGIKFIYPGVGEMVSTTVSTYECVTSAGLVGCSSLIVESKVVGYISGKALEAVAKVSPETAKAIIQYNQIKTYLDQGADIVNELEVNEEGEVEKGIISFNEEEYSIKEHFKNMTAGDIITSNSEFDFKTKTITIKEGGFLKLKTSDEEGEENQLSYENIKEGGKFRLNGKGNIEEADFFSNKDGAIYKMGNNSAIKVNAGTHLLYRKGVLRILKEKGGVQYNGLDLSLNQGYMDLFKDEISCLDCKVGSVHLKAGATKIGILELKKDGYLLKKGSADYENLRFITKNDAESVLIANSESELSKTENWVRVKGREIEIHSSKDKKIKLEVLPGNQVLNTFELSLKKDKKGNYVYDKAGNFIEEINPDKRDRLDFSVENGDIIKIIDREDGGKIPMLMHKPSGKGATTIKNGRISLNLEEGNIKTSHESITNFMYPKKEQKKFESVALQLQSPILKKHELRMNSANMYEILSSDKKNNPIGFNSNNYELSTSLEENLRLQSMDHLKISYPQIEFSTSGYKGKDPSPEMVSIIHSWIKENPENLKYIDRIDMSATRMHSFASGSGGLYLSERTLDPYFKRSRHEDTKGTVYHEIGHLKDFHIGGKEKELLKARKKKNAPPKMHKIYDQVIVKVGHNLIQDEEFIELKKETISKLKNTIENKGVKFTDSGYIITERSLSSPFNLKYTEITQDDLNAKLIKKYFGGKEFNELTKEEKKLFLIHDFLESEYIEKPLGKDVEYLPSGMDVISQYFLDTGSKFIEEGDDPSYTYLSTNPRFESLYSLPAEFPQNQEFEAIQRQIYDLYEKKYGLPDPYAFHRSRSGSMVYAELSSTYEEETINERRFKIQKGTPGQRKMFKKLTQIAFDAGKIKMEEFTKIMGEDTNGDDFGDIFCKTEDCIEFRCVEYKLLCCEQYPESPNC